MRLIRKHLLPLICLISLAACATPKQKFDRAANQGIQTIALLPCDEPSDLESGMVTHPGQVFGIAGMIVGSIDKAEKSSGLTQQMRATKFSACAELLSALETGLQARNYRVVRAAAERPAPNTWIENYGSVPTEADAILDVVIRSVGYVAPAALRNYRPVVRVSARLAAGPGRQVVYSEQISYGLRDQRGETVIPADQQHGISDYAELSSSPERAAEGIRAGIRRVAQSIAQQL